MNRSIVLLLVISLIFPYIANSTATFTIQETEKISLEPTVKDPDSDDKLEIRYTLPLNENGEWQTSYGDAGAYNATITVFDGTTSVSENVLIIVERKEETPKIDFFMPEKDELNINEADSINFSISASDLNKDELSYAWLFDGKEAGHRQELSYHATYNDAGSHEISVNVSDGKASASKTWLVNIADVDLAGLLDEIKDAVVNENDIVRLAVPNFEEYGLRYSISEPVGNENEWHTTYNDSGSYEISIKADGNGFSANKIVKVVVNDVDRALVFDEIGNKVLNENEELKITLNAHDPDGDEITYSASNLPKGAELEENVFIWRPDYTAVKKEGFVDIVMDKFRVLSKSFYVQFTASSKDRKILQNIIITVRDVNTAPVLEDLEPITINEGDILKIVPKAYDMDGDKVSLSYSGFINTDTFSSGFDDSGTYYVKVAASDGLLETSKFVRIDINQTNRAPLFSEFQDIKANEGDNIAILLNANDPDGDELSYSIDNPQEGSSLKGNAFFWQPGFNFAGNKETKKLDLVFVASDGKTEARQIAKIEISDKNRAPRIVDATKSTVANVNKPVLMFVKAVDDDGDELAYTWDFGFFEKYKATATHQRTFTAKGTKTVKVIVSDGVDEAEQVINVNVI